MKDILIINDFVSKGKIAGNMAEVVFSYKQFNTYFIPSALISNNFAYGKVSILNTNQYIKSTLDVYKELGFEFDIVFIGYVEDYEQKDIILDFLNDLTYKPLIILDPIMGDNGSLYNSVGEEKINIYKEILEYADICLPNYTEANFLGLADYDSLTIDDKKYVITSLEEDGKFYSCGISDEIYKKSFEKIDLRVSGTGDLFDAIFICQFIATGDFKGSIAYATDKMDEILILQKNNHPASMDIFIESYLDRLD